MLRQNKGCSSLCGPVAQLGARFHGMEEVTGSIPVRSTNQTNNLDGPSLRPRNVRGVTCVMTRGYALACSPSYQAVNPWAHSSFNMVSVLLLGFLLPNDEARAP